jgi:hypothetical protein
MLSLYWLNFLLVAYSIWDYNEQSVLIILIELLIWFGMYTSDKLFRLINENIYSPGALAVIFYCYLAIVILNAGYFSQCAYRFVLAMLEVPI